MDDLISRQAALEKVRTMQTYKLFMGDDMILVDKAEVQTELMMLPSAQSEIIHCGECTYREIRGVDGFCDHITGEEIMVRKTDYCKWGRKENR